MFLTQSSPTVDYGLLIIQTIAVLAVIAATAWAFVRFIGPRLRGGGAQSRMRILERLTFDPRRTIYIVEVDGAQLLIGVSDGAIALLKQLEPPDDQPATEAGPAAP